MLSENEKKVLFELDMDCRMPFKRIAERQNLQTSTVFSIVQRLEEKGIIEGYSIRGNFHPVGYTTYHFYLEMSWMSKREYQKFISWIQQNSSISFSLKLLGSYRFLMTSKTKNFEELEEMLQELETKFEKSLVHIEVCPHLSTHFFPMKYLVKRTPIVEPASVRNTQSISHDSLDIKIINELKKNARIQTLEISKKLDCTEKTVRERLKKLKERGIIKRFFTKVNLQKIGYSWYLALYRLNKRDKQKLRQLLQLANEHPNITFLCESRGYWSITINLHSTSEQECDKVLDEVRSVLREDIVKEQICKVLEVIKDEFAMKA